MANYTCFESTMLGSTHYAERIFDCVADIDIENGTFGYLNGLADGETHIYNFVAGTKAGAKVVVVDQPAWTCDTSRMGNQRKDKFVIEAGTPFRVRVLKVTDEFAINIEGFTADTKALVAETEDFAVANVFVTIDATGKLVAKTEATEGAVMEAKIMRKRITGGNLVTKAHKYGYSRTMYEAKIEVLA